MFRLLFLNLGLLRIIAFTMTSEFEGSSTSGRNQIIFLVFGFVAILEGLLAAVHLINLPSDGGNLLFNLSLPRLALLSPIILLFLSNVVFTYLLLRNRQLANSLADKIRCFNAGTFIFFLSAFAALIFLVPIILEDLYKSTEVFTYYAYAQRLIPLTGYTSGLLTQSALVIVWFNRHRLIGCFRENLTFFSYWTFTFTGIVILYLLIAITRIGLTTDPVGWGLPTVPLMEWQIWIAVFASVTFHGLSRTRFFLGFRKYQSTHPYLSNTAISILIWIIASIVWLSQSVPPGFFATPPRAPNFEIYPFSDAAFYDFHAQTVLIGLGYRGETIPPRPLYILFLTIAHLIAGQEYNGLIVVQTLLLALFPVLVFWIGKKLANTGVGLMAAYFVILREWTSILSTPFTSDISNSKLLFADLPAALVIAALLLVTIYWLEKPGSKKIALLTGGMLGISLLVRTQIIILLPVILGFYWLNSRKIRLRVLITGSGIFLLGLILAISPWMIRNYNITDQLVFDHPESQTRVMAQRYSPETELTDLDRSPDESTGDYNNRLSAFIRQVVYKNPLYVTQFVTSHWINAEISNLFIFPIRFSIHAPSELFIPTHAFWEEWKGFLTSGQVAITLFNLAIFTAGVVFMARKHFWAGLLPLAFNLAYHLSNAAARNSGWRYLLPADWLFLVYFSAGIVCLTSICQMNRQLPDYEISKTKRNSGFLTPILIGLVIFIIGAAPVIAENVFPRLFTPLTTESVANILDKRVGSLIPDERSQIETLLNDPEVILMNGRMLYPRFYEPGEGEEKTGKTGYEPLPYGRYVFLVAGEPEGTVIFPHTISNLPLRHAEPAIIIGCRDGLAVKAQLVAPRHEPGQLYTSRPIEDWSCSQ